MAARVASSLATIRLDPDDVATVRRLAEQRGVDDQEFVTRIVHDAIQREVGRTA